MSEHKYIWLQPDCCADPDEGRHWCQDPDPVECEDGKAWIKYILASEAEAQLTEANAELELMRPVFKAAISLYKRWLSAGHVEYINMICDSADEDDYDASDLAELMLIEQARKLEATHPSKPEDKC